MLRTARTLHTSPVPRMLDPGTLAELALQHIPSAVPAWAAVAVSTVTLRAAVSLPLGTYQQHVLARLELLRPEMREWSEAIKHNVVIRCRRDGKSPEEAQRIMASEVGMMIVLVLI